MPCSGVLPCVLSKLLRGAVFVKLYLKTLALNSLASVLIGWLVPAAILITGAIIGRTGEQPILIYTPTMRAYVFMNVQ